MTHHDDPDFATEPVPGLPERLPPGEEMLWQGRPETMALARSALKLGWVAGYFVLLAVWRVGVSSADMGLARALPLALPFLGLGVVACAILYAIAYVQARATLYTITTSRVAMRIGAALTLTANLPYPRIASADLASAPGGTGTISLSTLGETRLSYFVLWPHVRPWHMKRVQPSLRCIPDAGRVAAILADAADARVNRPEIAPRPMAVAAE